MIVYGYAIATMYTNDGTYMIQTRIPSAHGPMMSEDYRGAKVTNYTPDSELPWYPSLLLPTTPTWGDVVVLTSTNESTTDFLVLGVTGGQYKSEPYLGR